MHHSAQEPGDVPAAERGFLVISLLMMSLLLAGLLWIGLHTWAATARQNRRVLKQLAEQARTLAVQRSSAVPTATTTSADAAADTVP